jgi:3'-phosphoadenosine 5'-phosphosulfate sulfotransferase (PAPS reductase)/FAD synthetase
MKSLELFGSAADAHDDTVVIPHLREQLGFGFPVGDAEKEKAGVYFSAPDIDLGRYDHAIIASSGGKDSIAALLHLKDTGFDMSKVELWHHDVDGREGSTLMDWTFMADYNRKLAQAFNVPLYFSWLEGGFEGEMLKENCPSRPHKVETPDGLLTLERDQSRIGTRLRFPQLSANLQTRWCSSALKIDVGRRAMTNQERFEGKSVLFISGERREESSNRAKYNQLEPHACDRRAGRKARLVDAWRPVLHWSEEQVWDALQRHSVIAPVPYRLGWSRSSCMTCIYNGPQIWATIEKYFPHRIGAIAGYETQFGTTISRARIPIFDVARSAKPMELEDLEALEQAGLHEYFLPVIGAPGVWKMPIGAFGKEGCGSE